MRLKQFGNSNDEFLMDDKELEQKNTLYIQTNE